jgi:hypothetical protein
MNVLLGYQDQPASGGADVTGRRIEDDQELDSTGLSCNHGPSIVTRNPCELSRNSTGFLIVFGPDSIG